MFKLKSTLFFILVNKMKKCIFFFLIASSPVPETNALIDDRLP